MYPQKGNKTMSENAVPPKKYKHYVHSPFSLNLQGLKVSVTDKGKIVLTQDQSDGTFDEITSSAALINKVAAMLEMSPQFSLDHWGVKVKTNDNGSIVLTEDHSDGTFDEIITTAGNIMNIFRMLLNTRRVTYKDHPFRESQDTPNNTEDKDNG